MKRTKIIYALLLACASITLPGCSDLTPVDYSEINPSNFPKTESDIQSLVLSCYFPLRGSWWDGIFSTSERGVMFLNDATTGILTGTFGEQKMCSQLNYFPESTGITWFYYTRRKDYAEGYSQKISRCTLVLDAIANSTLDNATKQRYEAEVRCARAFLSYILYDMYGPLVVAPLEVLKNPLEEKPLPRLSRAEMAKFIEDDLLFAGQHLPLPANTEYGRFSRGLAKMLLIRLYLHETADYNYPEGLTHGDKSNYDKVVTLARELKDPQYGYALQSDYNAMFARGGQGKDNKEIIFALPCSYEGPSLNQWHMMVLPTDYAGHGMGSGWGTVTSTWYFYDSFESGDVRRQGLLTSYTTSGGTTVDRNTPQSPLAAGPIPLKIGYDPGVKGSGGYTDIDIVLFRYADVYLSLAEGLCQKQGATTADLHEAIDNVNVVRNRAGLSSLSYANYTQAEDVLNAILKERWHEFWCENGQYRSDMIRYHRLVPLVRAINQSPYAADYKELYPLPLEVITDGKGQVKQNPGY
ncbi:RagB/SusD family nutrient uptake outer membrane protein [Segatella oulorum]|uniref:RagB/SusD family nutrient uptake outer membrane protein n=1 Tax=Segatella oulorum TaxID=28136 RepID=UPI0028E7A52F|nr:RagB/SusD family nutrient uptake outer membrane protein [Segatella oulorum]